jgi:hypothetical protein
MLEFVNIQEEISYQEKEGMPIIPFGIQVSPPDRPIDFQYDAFEAVTSFKAIRTNANNCYIDEYDLSTSLISYDGQAHRCSGTETFNVTLPNGYFYFLVNGKFKSVTFQLTYELPPNYLELYEGGFLELYNGSNLQLYN